MNFKGSLRLYLFSPCRVKKDVNKWGLILVFSCFSLFPPTRTHAWLFHLKKVMHISLSLKKEEKIPRLFLNKRTTGFTSISL